MGVPIKNNCNCNRHPKTTRLTSHNSLKDNNLQYFSETNPAIQKPDRDTDLVKICPLKGTKIMQKVLIPMAIPALSAHLTETKFMHKTPNITGFAGKCGF